MFRTRMNDTRIRWTQNSLFALGILIAVIMITRLQLGGDALCILARGWLLAKKGIWAHLGAGASGGGYVPGGLTALLVGFPLMIWMDYRAPVVLILIFHIIAYVLFDRVLKKSVSPEARIVFAIIYWLNPWQLYQAAWLDNSNYGFLASAVHLWACYHQRHRSSFLHSALMVAVVGLSVQLHLNAMILVIAAAFLWFRGYWKPNWAGVALGSVITCAALMPFLLEALHHPAELLPASKDPVGSSLKQFWPIFKGIGYWFRYASLWCSKRSMLVFDFTPGLSESADAILRAILFFIGHVMGTLTVLVSVMANIWMWRRFRAERAVPVNQLSNRSWLRGYALWCLAACITSNALSPIATMWWHNLNILHATVLPVILWAEALLRTKKAPVARKVMAGFAFIAVSLMIGLTFGGEFFNQPVQQPIIEHPVAEHELISDFDFAEQYILQRWPEKHKYFYRTYMRQYELHPQVNKKTDGEEAKGLKNIQNISQNP